jgi:hypothetical protein
VISAFLVGEALADDPPPIRADGRITANTRRCCASAPPPASLS